MARKIEIEIVGDTSSLERALSRAGKTSQSSFQKIGRAAGAAGAAIFAGLAVVAKVGFDELAEGQKVTAQTNAVLKSTGKIANVTAQDVESLASELSNLSGVDDELIGASENLLLTFTRIRNEVGKGNDIFNQATKAALDMSVAMGTDLQSATLQVGKALNDPIRGLTALRRVGVSFTAAQEKQIEALVESGKSLQAQKIILAELNKEFGGSAKAAGETLPGQLAKARNAFDEVAAGLVESLLPAITSILAKLTTFTNWARENPKQMKLVVVALGALATALVAASVAQAALNLAVLANPYVAAAAAILVVVGALVVLQKKTQFVTKHWQVFLAVIPGFGVAFVAVISLIKLGVRSFDTLVAAFNKVKKVAGPVFSFVAAQVRLIISPILLAISAVERLIDAWNRLKGVAGGLSGATNAPVGRGRPFSNPNRSAQGGIVRSTGAAIIHGGEAIVPARVARGGFGGNSAAGAGQFALVWAGNDFIGWLQDQDRRTRRGNGGRGILG